MRNHTLPTSVREVFEVTKDLPAREIGFRLVSFLVEAEHGNWDGVPSRDKAAYGRLLHDLARWLRYDTYERKYVFTGTQYLTADRE